MRALHFTVALLGWSFPSAHVLVFSVDVVWPASAPAPEGYGSVSQWLEPREEF